MKVTFPATSQSPDTQEWVRRGRTLEYFTLGWNLIEAAVAIGAGIAAGSTALWGFGLDSLIESLSGLVLLWRLGEAGTRQPVLPGRESAAERREQTALRLVGGCFLILAAYVAVDASLALWRRERPDASFVGIGLAAVSLVVMPILARRKRQAAGHLGSRALAADSRQTDFCAYLSAILLAGLVLNAVLGWWWADPLGALVMVVLIVREGVAALRGETCCDVCELQ